MDLTRTHLAHLDSPAPTGMVVLAIGGLALLLAACQASSSSAPRPDRGAGMESPSLLDAPDPVVVDWSAATYDAFVAGEKYANSLRAVKVMAMVHIAQHDALAAIRPSYASYALNERAPDAHPVAAAASAAFEVLAAELPSQRESLGERLALSLASVPAGRARDEGLALGKRAAAAIRAKRQDDGSNVELLVKLGWESQPQKPGAYRPVPPYDFVFAPEWRRLQPFALQTPEQFRVPPPPALDSDAYAAGFAEVKAMGRKGSTKRSADQTSYAKFWYELSDIGWNRIGRVVATERRLGLQASARMFAMLNMALSDAYVAGWDSKVHYDFWRPTTAIRAAANDGNPATEADPSWESEEVVPPVHDFPSTHSALGDAGAEVLAHVLGDATAFSFTSTTAAVAGSTRRFASFTEAANENADSRVQGGLHFRFSCQAGQALGRQVGAWVVATTLRPLPLVASSR